MGSGRAEKGYRASLALYPGPNSALSPASPPGFVTALTTARSRDVPAECFDERLPRRLPYYESPGACCFCPSTPQASTIPASLLVITCERNASLSDLPISSGTTPLTVPAARLKRNLAPEALQEVQVHDAQSS